MTRSGRSDFGSFFCDRGCFFAGSSPTRFASSQKSTRMTIAFFSEVHLDAELGQPRSQRIGRTQPGGAVPADRPERRHRVKEVVDVGAWLEPDPSELELPAQPDIELVVPWFEHRVRRHETDNGDAGG